MSIGLDIGASKIVAALVREGAIVDQAHEPTDKTRLLDQIIRLTQKFNEKLPVGIGIAGQIEEGEVIFSPNLGLVNFPVKLLLERAIGVPVRVINDVKAAAYAEWSMGAGRGAKRLFVSFLGTGIGGAMIDRGQLLGGCAGEIGHMVIRQGGLLCGCGREGCFEAYAGGWGIANRGEKKSAKEVFLMGPDRILDEAYTALVTGFANIANLFNPDRLVIGGSLLEGYELAFPPFMANLERDVKKESLEAARRRLTIVPATLADLAGVLGAAALALENSAKPKSRASRNKRHLKDVGRGRGVGHRIGVGQGALDAAHNVADDSRVFA